MHKIKRSLQRKAELEEELRQHQLELERREQDRQQRLEQARIDRPRDEATSLRQARNIRHYPKLSNRRSSMKALSLRLTKWSVGHAGRSRRRIASTPSNAGDFSNRCKVMNPAANNRGGRMWGFLRLKNYRM